MTRRGNVSGFWLAAAGVVCAACNSATMRSVGAGPTMPRSRMLADAPSQLASGSFRDRWFDGNAELSGYHITQPRYGELRSGELVLTYVTEPMSKATRIKDDDAAKDDRLDVLKLNANLTFLTGIYPYSVMTSVFSPIDQWKGEEPFSPVKITTAVQEWCGHTFHGIWPGDVQINENLLSYFASEGETRRVIQRPNQTLFEDALLIQLRELDGAFAGGGQWVGSVVPSLWRLRRAHVPLEPVPATIVRKATAKNGKDVTEFTLTMGSYTKVFDVEASGAHRVLGWTTSDGETATLLATAKLPYWQLNHTGNESYRRQLGLQPQAALPPVVAPILPGAIGK